MGSLEARHSTLIICNQAALLLLIIHICGSLGSHTPVLNWPASGDDQITRLVPRLDLCEFIDAVRSVWPQFQVAPHRSRRVVIIASRLSSADKKSHLYTHIWTGILDDADDDVLHLIGGPGGGSTPQSVTVFQSTRALKTLAFRSHAREFRSEITSKIQEILKNGLNLV